MMRKIVVTGSSGKAGRAVVRELLDYGYEVLGVDVVPPHDRLCPFIRADITDLGQTFEVLRQADAVVHLAAIPAPGLQPDDVTMSSARRRRLGCNELSGHRVKPP